MRFLLSWTVLYERESLWQLIINEMKVCDYDEAGVYFDNNNT